MKRTLGILALLLTVAALPAQAQQDYGERFGQLAHAYALHPTNVETLYDMACFYFDNSHPMRSLPQAMHYIQRAEAEHIALLEKNKIKELTRLGKKGIDLTSLRRLKQAIRNAAQGTVALRTEMEAEEIEAYLAAFGDDADMVRKLRQLRIRQQYTDALAKGTPDACYRFLTSYPGTGEAAQMEERLRQMAPRLLAEADNEATIDAIAARYAASPSVAQAAERRKSSLAFAEAERQGSLEAYRHFLSRHPTSSESQPARERLDSLVDDSFARRHGIMQLAHFADSNADLPLADEALARMRQLIYANRDAEAAHYYVSHYKLDPYRSEVYARYYSWYAAEGNGAPLRRFAEANPDFIYPRALEDDLERSRDIDTIDLLAPYTEADYPRYAAYVRQLAGKGIALVPLQRMLQPLLSARNYRAALERIQQFELCFDNQWQAPYEELQRLVGTPQGRTLKTEWSDSAELLHPVVNPADGCLYLTRLWGGKRTLLRAERQAGGWQVADTLRLLNADPEADLTLFSFSADGSKMLLGCGGDIWIAERDPEGWRISDIPPYPVNTDYVETDAYLLPDGSGLLLASDRPGGQNVQPSDSLFHGDTALASDLWFIPYSRHQWGTPVNLGPAINTPYCERSPVMGRNLTTLFFVSDGHTGLGYGDLFVAERTSATDWTSWSAPRNVGRELNSSLRELSVSLAPDERRAYLASGGHGTKGGIYSFATWHDTARAYSPCTVGLLGLNAELVRVRLADLDRQVVLQTIDCLERDSVLPLNLRHDGHYALLADAGGLFVPAVVRSSPAPARMALQGYTFEHLVASDREVPLPAVGFSDSTGALLPVAELQLKQLAQFLQRRDGGSVELAVDVAGSDSRQAYEQSLVRGEAMRKLLVDCGVDPQRILISPYGNVRLGRQGRTSVAVRFRD